ncbi:MAG: peptidoglycan-binding protein [Bacilli bacterium]|nr:peptidoglycan-binding protein [Bacilli bacterium]
MAIRYPVVPNQITVHLGKPDEAARDIVVPFTDYISNVASSELYPTWPKVSLESNIYAIISFALNRIYNEWYPSKGYNFDITSSPLYDQTYTLDKQIYENIESIVQDIFNDYVVKGNQIQPYFTRYCDGRKTTCQGLLQWGTVSLANQGKNALQILRYYYGNDINIVKDAPVGDNISGYPGYVNRLGSVGNPVSAIQRDLNRIRINYPAIPKIESSLGIYDKQTEEAVKKFQEIFSLPITGNVDKATWYKIKYVYTSVKKLSDLYSEGLSPQEATFLYRDELKYGDTGIEMEYVHYYLDAISFVDPDIPHLRTNSVFNDNTKTMVMAFQKKYGLPVTGIITYTDWKVLQEVYNKLLMSFPKEYASYVNELYPDYFLSYGMRGDDVKRLQEFLLLICKYDKSIPGVKVNGEFDELTENSIKKIQTDYDLGVTGLVGPFTWRKIVELSKRK